jgi:ubiquinone/menaquinone biosynthesis C-methylase UbiE
MTEPAQYIHGVEPSEQARLAALNRITNAGFVEFLNVKDGARILEVGSGLGLLAADVAAAAPNVQVVGVEQSDKQIAAATKAPNIRYVQGDAHRLEFPDNSFDLVYARYVLEHVADPAKVLMEMRRVTREGGRVAACENDISLVRVDPPCPAFESVWNAFQQYQKQLGGDSHIGRRLYRLFRSAGFSSIELSIQPEVHWYGSTAFVGWIENLIGNIESAADGLAKSGFCTATEISDSIAELKGLRENKNASSHFMWNRAAAVR